MKKSLLSLGVLLAAFAGLLSWIAPHKQANREVFVVGDWYDVVIHRDKCHEQTHGFVVKVTPDWIVLGLLLSEGSGEEVTGVPVLMDLPVLEYFFTTRTRTSRTLSKLFQWIPRNAVTIEKREPASLAACGEVVWNVEPFCTDNAQVCWFDGKKTTATIDKIHATGFEVPIRVYHSSVEETPYLSRLPLIGRLFTNHSSTCEVQKKFLPIDSILCVQQSFVLTPEEIDRFNASRQTLAAATESQTQR
jgi:hypothetical protein